MCKRFVIYLFYISINLLYADISKPSFCHIRRDTLAVKGFLCGNQDSISGFYFIQIYNLSQKMPLKSIYVHESIYIFQRIFQ